MDSNYRTLREVFGFPDDDYAEDVDIHVLVDIPENVKKGLRILRHNSTLRMRDFAVGCD